MVQDSLCKFGSDTSLHDETKEAPRFDNENNIRFDGAALHPVRPSVPRALSLSSVTSRASRRTVEPSVALPGIFKTVSYKVDGASVSHGETRIDKSAAEFKQSTWHLETPAEVARALHSDTTQGLSIEQYAESFKTHGPNVLSSPRTNWAKKIFFHFFGGFGLLLMVAGILCCIAWKPLGNPDPASANLVLGVVLFIVFLLQAAFNFWQDFSSSQVMSSISGMLPSDVHVVRQGVKTTCQAKDLVPGDLIFISNGDRTPADVRFVSVGSSEFAFDKAILTGESKPVHATAECDEKGSNYLESASIGLQGTFCVGGSGYAIIVSTADSTVFGQIAKLTTEPRKGPTPLQKDIIRFILYVLCIVVCLIVLVCILWGVWLRKSYPDWITVPMLIVALVSICVAFIPEGLPIALTTCLVITAGAMRKHKILCRSLSIVETLGSVSVVCSDKTGTLTKNKMAVVSYSVGSTVMESATVAPAEEQLSLLSKLCNAATFTPPTRSNTLNERQMTGNATDQAIFRFGHQLVDEDVYLPQRAEVSFNSKNKFMIRLFEDDEGLQLMIKGAPDILLKRCTQMLNPDGSVVGLNADAVMAIQESWAERGQRVVLLAYKRMGDEVFGSCGFASKETIDTLIENSEDLVLAGLVGIVDPPKDDIHDVVTTLHQAGIRVMMVTGDFEATAIAIARMCGIVTHGLVQTVADLDPAFEIVDCNLWDRVIVDGAVGINSSDLDTLNDNQWEHITSYTEIVFSRTTPEQKLRIVEEFQKRRHIVAMTGDGVNDAPSLRQADVGVGMAEGSDIAKEAADIVLLDSFSSIVAALKFGRLVFENLKKTLAYLLPAGCYAELWAVLLNVIFGMPQMLSSFCMIIICCLTDCSAAITLAYEKPEKDLLKKKPRSISGARLADWRLVLNIYFIIGTYDTFVSMMMSFLYMREQGVPFHVLSMSFGDYGDHDPDFVAEHLKIASSIYFVTLVIMQFFNLMSVRTRYASLLQHSPITGQSRNLAMIPAMCFSLGMTFLFNYIPWFQKNLGTAIVPVKFYFIACGFGSVILCWDETRKYLVRRYPRCLLAKIAW